MSDFRLLKTGGGYAAADLILHLADRACLLVLFYAMGMVLYTLMYGNAALLVMGIAGMAAAGTVPSRFLLHAGIVRVRYPLVLYLAKQTGRDAAEITDALDRTAFLAEAVLTFLVSLLFSVRAAAAAAALFLPAVLLSGSCGGSPEREALRAALKAGLAVLAVCAAVCFGIMDQAAAGTGTDQAAALLMAVGGLACSGNPRAAVTLVTEAAVFAGALAMASAEGLFRMPSYALPAFMTAAVLCSTAAAAAECLLQRSRHVLLSASLSFLPVCAVSLAGGIQAFCIALGAGSMRLILLPVMAAALSGGEREWDEEDSPRLYEELSARHCPAAAMAAALSMVLVQAGSVLLYLRGMISWRHVLPAVLLYAVWASSAASAAGAGAVRRLAAERLHGKEDPDGMQSGGSGRQ